MWLQITPAGDALAGPRLLCLGLLPWSISYALDAVRSMGKGTAVALYRRAQWDLDALHFFPTTAARVLIASTAWLRTLCHFNFTAALWVRLPAESPVPRPWRRVAFTASAPWPLTGSAAA